MPEILDIFNNDAFSATTLTRAITVVPNTYGRIRDLGLFRDEPITTTSVIVAIENGVLNLLPTRQRGAPATLGSRARANLRSFVVPHIPHEDSVLATDVQNVLAMAGQGGLESVQGLVNRKLITMRAKHAITLENLRMGAIRGVIKDYDGSVLLNLFTSFNVTEQVVDFVLGTATTDVQGKCVEVTGYMEDNLMGETMTGVHALCSPEWFAKFISHANVKDAYRYYASAPNVLRDDVRKGFPFKGITFEEYRGSASYMQEDGTRSAPQRFIPAGDVRFIPLGTSDTFTNYWAPPDFWSQANVAPTVGTPDAEVFVAPLEPKKFGKGMDIHTESNPLPLVKRPRASRARHHLELTEADMLMREKGKKDAEPVGMGWDESQAALRAGTHEVVDQQEVAAVRGEQSERDVDYESMSRAELDALAGERGVDISGAKNKGDVIAALKA